MLHLFCGDNFHPLFQRLPLSECNEKIIFTNFIKRFYLLEPLLNCNELYWLRCHKLTHPLTAKSVVIFNFIFDDLWVGDHFHVVMIIWVFPYHVNKLIRSQLFLPHHLEECGHFRIVNWVVSLLHIFFRNGWRYGLHFDGLQLRFFCRWFSLVGLSDLFITSCHSGKGISSTCPSGWYETSIIGTQPLFDTGFFARGDPRKELYLWLFFFLFKWFLARLLWIQICVHKIAVWYHRHFWAEACSRWHYFWFCRAC